MIPRIMHQSWMGEIPDRIADLIRTARDTHPGWDWRLYDERSALEQLTPAGARAWAAVPKAWPADTVPRIRSAVLRLDLLWRHGGVWLDADTHVLRPLDPLLELGVSAFCVWEDPAKACNTPLGAVQGHPFIGRMRTSFELFGRARADHRIRRRLTMTCIDEHLGDDVTVFEGALLAPYSWRQARDEPDEYPTDFGSAFVVHHWNYARPVTPPG